MQHHAARSYDSTIVQILDFIPNGWRSMEQFLVALASRMNQEQCRTVFVFSGEPGERMKAALHELDSPFLVVGDPMSAADARRITPLLKQMQPVLIQTHFLSMFNPLLRGIKNGSGARRLVVTDHSSGVVSPKTLPKDLLARLRGRVAASYIDQVIGVSQYVCRRDVEGVYFPADKVRCILNGVDIERFSPGPRRADAQAPMRLGFIGYHIPAKGLSTLLNAVARVQASGRSFELVIAGTGPNTADYQRQVGELGLADCTRFLGQITDTAAFYRELDVLVVPSEWQEACPFVVAEAGACGACLITSDAGGIPEIVGPNREAGIIFPRTDVDALTGALIELLDSPTLRAAMGERARQRMVEQFSIGGTVDAYAKALLTLMH